MSAPNRWLHLRHPDGFDERAFGQFRAHCRVFRAYVNELLQNWEDIGAGNYEAPAYEFFEPEISADRTIVTLPIGGASVLGTHARIENGSSHMLWRFFRPSFREKLEEGITENIGHGNQTNWRKVPPLIIPLPPDVADA
jgi:hypothetical protein